MSRSAAKKYARILATTANKQEVEEAKGYLLAISALFKEAKFKDTVLSPLVSAEEKSELLLGKSNANKILTNLVKLLIEKENIALIPYIYEELRLADAVASNAFEGFVYSSNDVDAATLDQLKGSVSKKYNATIDFKQVKSDKDGFRVEVPDLGIEVSFSQDRLKSQIITHILRGI